MKNTKQTIRSEKKGLLTFIATGIDNSSFAFYWAFIGVIIQFFHVSLSISGTLGVFNLRDPILMVIGEASLAILVAGFFAATLLFVTLRSGSIKVETKRKPEKIKVAKRKRRKYRWIIFAFLLFDMLVAYYFWVLIVFMGTTLFEVAAMEVINTMKENWILLIFIMSIVVMHPLTLVFYAQEIDLKKWIKKS